MDKIKIYSPVQVAAASFIGGPGAVVYTIVKNFDAMGERAKAQKALIGGCVFVLLLFCLLPFLPDKFPPIVLPLFYTAGAWVVAEKHQMTKMAIQQSDFYTFQTRSNIAIVSTGFLAAFVITFMLWFSALEMAGIVTITD